MGKSCKRIITNLKPNSKMENKSNYFKRDAVVEVQVEMPVVEEIEAEVVGNGEEVLIEKEMPENYY
jgi:hypothetical protein